MKRYEKLAEEITQSIQLGTLRKGDKLPSVRQVKLERGISASTVFKAYYLLEAKGLIVARARSGYYVSKGATTIPQIVMPTVDGNLTITDVDVIDLVFNILSSVRHKEVIPFGSAFPSPDLFPLAKIAKHLGAAARKMDPWLTVKDIGIGDANLRRQIALRYLMDGMTIPAEEIIITSGALEGLNLCLSAVTKPGDCVIIESATFYAALQAIERNGLKAVEVPSHPQYGIDLESLELVIQQYQPKACWLMTNFQNPTGSLMPNEHKKQLVELLTNYQIPLIEDDVYNELYFGKYKPLPAKAFDQAGIVMHCSSFSKCLAPGYRIGWVAPGKYAQAIERLKLTTSIAVSVPTQIALAGYLSEGGYDRHLRGLRHQLMMQQIVFIEILESCFPKGVQLTKPDGGYFLWVKLPHGVNALQLHQIALSRNISIAPGPMFSASQKLTQYMRLNYGHVINERSAMALRELGNMIVELT